jgi:hypothetical protein
LESQIILKSLEARKPKVLNRIAKIKGPKQDSQFRVMFAVYEGNVFVCLFDGFNATFNNISVISWWSVLLVEQTGGLRENHQPVASH